MKWSHEAVHKLTYITERRLTDDDVDLNLSLPDRHASILSKPDNPQRTSPLWSKLPAELRAAIFALVLADPEDPQRGRQYNNSNRFVYSRGLLVREDDLPLLRCCRAAYRECWLEAVVLRERKYWISGGVDSFGLRPKDMRVDYVLPRVLDRLGLDKIEVRSLRVFGRTTELYGGDLTKLLSNPLLHPRSVTLVVRPRCWPMGLNNNRTFKARWVRDAALRMSPSTKEFRIELGCYQGRRRDINHFAQVMRERWFLVRSDGTLMFADCSGRDQETASWTETSTKHNLRPWMSNPRQFPEDHHYYMNTVIFRREEDLVRRGGVISEQARLLAEKYQSEDEQTKRWMKRRTRGQSSTPSASNSQASDEDYDDEMDLNVPGTVDREDQSDGPMGPVPSAKSRKQEARLVAVSNDLSWWVRSWRYNILYLIAVGVVPVAVCMALGVGLCRLGLWCVFG